MLSIGDVIAQQLTDAVERVTGVDHHGLATALALFVVPSGRAFALHSVSSRAGDPGTSAAAVALVSTAGVTATMRPSEDWRGPVVDHVIRPLTGAATSLLSSTILAVTSFVLVGVHG